MILEKYAELGLAYQSFSDMQVAHFVKCADLLEEVILGRAAARRCSAAVKGEVMVEVRDGQGQVARACEDRGFKAKAWVIEGLSSAQALPLALRHLSRTERLSAGSTFQNLGSRNRRSRLDTSGNQMKRCARVRQLVTQTSSVLY